MPEDQPEDGLCEVCKTLQPVAWTDDYGREYCQGCLDEAVEMPTMRSVALAYLAATIPFKVGDRVECRTAGALYDGVGVIDQVSTNLAHFGTPVYPAFHVVLEEKAYPEAPDDLWYMEPQLRKVDH